MKEILKIVNCKNKILVINNKNKILKKIEKDEIRNYFDSIPTFEYMFNMFLNYQKDGYLIKFEEGSDLNG